ncbi:MAG: hypothetical protein ACYT04_65230, partial [Nostoc sp.]
MTKRLLTILVQCQDAMRDNEMRSPTRGVAHRAIKKLIRPNLAEIFQAELLQKIFVSSSPLSRWLTYLGRGTVKGGQVCCRTWGCVFSQEKKCPDSNIACYSPKVF